MNCVLLLWVQAGAGACWQAKKKKKSRRGREAGEATEATFGRDQGKEAAGGRCKSAEVPWGGGAWRGEKAVAAATPLPQIEVGA